MYYKYIKIHLKELIVHLKENDVNKIKKIRESEGISLRTIADKTGLSIRYLHFIENGERTPSLSTAKRIANCLNHTIEELFFDEG